jgi:hypothetical protein
MKKAKMRKSLLPEPFFGRLYDAVSHFFCSKSFWLMLIGLQVKFELRLYNLNPVMADISLDLETESELGLRNEDKNSCSLTSKWCLL